MKLFVGPSPINGLGVFAGELVRTGATVHVLSGERISLLRAAARVLLGRLTMDNPLTVGRFSYFHLDDLSVKFNHSCGPNAGLRGQSELFAHRDIAAGEEITYDYSLTVLPNVVTFGWRMPCRCGSDLCRGSVADIRGVPSTLVESLRERRQLQDFVLTWLERRSHTRLD